MGNKFVPSWRVEFEIMSALQYGSLSTTSICYSCTFKKDTVTKAITYMLKPDVKLIEVDAPRTKYDEAFYKLSEKGKQTFKEYKAREEADRKVKESVIHEAILYPEFVARIGYERFHKLKRYPVVITQDGDTLRLNKYDPATQTYGTNLKDKRVSAGEKVMIKQIHIKGLIGGSNSLEKHLDKLERESIGKLLETIEVLEGKLSKAHEELRLLKKERDALLATYEMQFQEKPNFD